jgi:hypothetical protein
MQKVVGSNPISRFFANPLHVGGLGSAWVAETRSNHPRISPLSQALMRISAWNGSDARRLAPIPPCMIPCSGKDVLAALEYAAAAAQERELALVAPVA